MRPDRPNWMTSERAEDQLTTGEHSLGTGLYRIYGTVGFGIIGGAQAVLGY